MLGRVFRREVEPHVQHAPRRHPAALLAPHRVAGQDPRRACILALGRQIFEAVVAATRGGQRRLPGNLNPPAAGTIFGAAWAARLADA